METVKSRLDELNAQYFLKWLVQFMEAVPECTCLAITVSGDHEYSDSGGTYFSRSIEATCSLDKPLSVRAHDLVPITEDLCDDRFDNPGEVLAERFAENTLDTDTCFILPDREGADSISLKLTREALQAARDSSGVVNLKSLLDTLCPSQ